MSQRTPTRPATGKEKPRWSGAKPERQRYARKRDRAVKHLKRKMASEGILRELKRRRHYMKPSVRRRKKAAEAARRRRKRIKQIATERS